MIRWYQPRRWRPPNNPTPQARQVWGALFPGHPWHKGWSVQWVGFMRGALGLTLYTRKRILLSYGDHAGPVIVTRRQVHDSGLVSYFKAPRSLPVETLLHEFVHVRCPGLRHGREFRSLVNALRERLGFEPVENP